MQDRQMDRWPTDRRSETNIPLQQLRCAQGIINETQTRKTKNKHWAVSMSRSITMNACMRLSCLPSYCFKSNMFQWVTMAIIIDAPKCILWKTSQLEIIYHFRLRKKLWCYKWTLLYHGQLWWRHQMETFSALLAICAGNSPVTGEFPAQRPVTWSFDVFFDLHLNKRLSKQSSGDLRCHCVHHDVTVMIL